MARGRSPGQFSLSGLSGNYPGTIWELSRILPNGPPYLAWPGLAGQAGLAGWPGWPGWPSLAGLACLPGRLLMTSCIDFENMLTPFVAFTIKTDYF